MGYSWLWLKLLIRNKLYLSASYISALLSLQPKMTPNEQFPLQCGGGFFVVGGTVRVTVGVIYCGVWFFGMHSPFL